MPEITKRRVTATFTQARGLDDEGRQVFDRHVSVDYVRPDFLQAYVEDAQARGWVCEISDEPDAGPGGYHGATYVPEHLDHPLAGQLFPATTEED